MVVMPPPRVSAVGDASYELVHLPSADGSVPAVVFSGGANPACVFVFLPGIMGNLDVPGVGEASCDLGLDRWASPSGRGSMFARLASELASGEDAPVAPWAPRDRRSAFHAKKARASSAATRETRTRRFRAACGRLFARRNYTYRRTEGIVTMPGPFPPIIPMFLEEGRRGRARRITTYRPGR